MVCRVTGVCARLKKCCVSSVGVGGGNKNSGGGFRIWREDVSAVPCGADFHPIVSF